MVEYQPDEQHPMMNSEDTKKAGAEDMTEQDAEESVEVVCSLVVRNESRCTECSLASDDGPGSSASAQWEDFTPISGGRESARSEVAMSTADPTDETEGSDAELATLASLALEKMEEEEQEEGEEENESGSEGDSVCDPIEFSVKLNKLNRMNSIRRAGLPPEPATPSVTDVIRLRYHLSPEMIEEKSDCEFNFSFPLPTPLKDRPAGEAADTRADQTPLKYHLVNICTIGAGSFGSVKLARHKVTGQYYALKCLYIPALVEKRQVEHVHHEKKILQLLNHPFIVKLYDTAKDLSNLYMIMEFLAGGELFSYLRMSRSFASPVVKFYAAEIVLALEYLHSMSIAYRDLKPENLMLTADGHVKLTDFGFAKHIDNKSYTLCGTPSYLAPEVINREGHNRMVDFWALGILIFELMAGRTPFGGSSLEEVHQSIDDCFCAGGPGVEFLPKIFSVNAKDLICRLLTVDMTRRLGSKSIDEIKRHRWFDWCNWGEIYAKTMTPPLVPTIYCDGDTGNFDSFEETGKRRAAKQRELDLFDEW